MHGASGYSLLSNHDFKTDKYSLIGYAIDGPAHPLRKQLDSFYTDDISILQVLQKEWVFSDESTSGFACGFHYNVYFVKNGEKIDEFLFNLDKPCNTVQTKEGTFFFDPDKFIRFKRKFSKMEIFQYEFLSVAEARNFYSGLACDSNVVWYEEPYSKEKVPFWLKYEGYFEIDYPCQIGCYEFEDFSVWEYPDQSRCIEQEIERCLYVANEEIGKIFPDKDIEIDRGNVGPDSFEITIRCSKEIYNDFYFYDKKSNWNNYKPELNVYRRGNIFPLPQ